MRSLADLLADGLSADDLETLASNNYARKLDVFKVDIQLCALAVEMGGAVKSTVAGELHYSTTTVPRLAAMLDLPEEAISLDTKIGAYWVAINNDATPEQIHAAVESGVETPAQMKAYLGVESERGPVCVDCPVCGARFEK